MTKRNTHHFRVTVEKISEALEENHVERSLTFDVQHHDDLLAVAARVRSATAFAVDDANALAIGLKLFTGVMQSHRHDSLFAGIQPTMRTFIGNLKSRVASTTSAK